MKDFLECVQRSLMTLDLAAVGNIVSELRVLRDRGGRLFVIGNGGGAAHASHAVADFRTLCGIEAYSPDNLPNLTALANDEGWPETYRQWLETSWLGVEDAVLVVSVGGGDAVRNVSANLVRAVELAIERTAAILGILGRDGGYTAQHATADVLIPCDRPEWVTPVVEGVQSVVLHMIVSDPRLAVKKAKWESVDAQGGVSRS